jgi:hypothetical protein
MNVARDLLDDLATIGATVEPAGDRLILHAGSTAIPARLVSRVREAKAELVALLTESTHVAPSESIKPDPLARRVHRSIGPIGLMKAMDSVPKRYLAAWGQFQCQCPASVTEQAWRQAIDDAGRFLDQWGSLAVEFGWSPGDLFDVPRDGAMGLAWWLKGRAVTALGPEHACVGQPAYDRVTRREWVNPYSRPVRPVSLSPILEHQQRIMQRVLGR